MTRGKRIAIVLGGVAGVLAVWAGLQQFGFGAGYRLLRDAGGAVPESRYAAIEREPYKLGEYSEYGEILARPVFNETRAPEATSDATAGEGEPAAPTASPLNVALTGVILMPELQLAFVRDNATNTVQRVRVGNPLQGEQSGWKLVELKARGAVFEGEGLGRQELELATDTAGAPTAPPVIAAAVVAPEDPTQQPAVATAAVAADPSAGRPPGNNINPDAIRQRIEERRRQLREEAQRMMQEQQNKQ